MVVASRNSSTNFLLDLLRLRRASAEETSVAGSLRTSWLGLQRFDGTACGQREGARRFLASSRSRVNAVLAALLMQLSGCENHYLVYPHHDPPGVTTWSEDVTRGALLVHLEWVQPPGSGPFPTVIVHPEGGHLAGDMKGVTRDLAQHGYLAVAVDYQRLLQLELAAFEGKPASLFARRYRALASALSCFSLGLGYAWALVDEDRLGWHDRISKTYVRSGDRVIG
jgi:hypothetical protein